MGLVVGRARGAREYDEKSVLLSADAAAAKARMEETVRRAETLDVSLAEARGELSAGRTRLPTFAVVSTEALRSNSQSFEG